MMEGGRAGRVVKGEAAFEMGGTWTKEETNLLNPANAEKKSRTRHAGGGGSDDTMNASKHSRAKNPGTEGGGTPRQRNRRKKQGSVARKMTLAKREKGRGTKPKKKKGRVFCQRRHATSRSKEMMKS